MTDDGSRGFNSGSTIPTKISAPPLHCNNDNRSPMTSHDVTAANRGSKQKINAARADDMWRCAYAWSTNEPVLANTTVQANATANSAVHTIRGRSSSSAATPERTAVTAS